MKRSPRLIAVLSFDVLDLFLEGLEIGLEVEDEPCGARFPDLGSRGIHLAVDLLHEMVEVPADGPSRGEKAPQLDEVGLETIDFFRDVGAVGKQRDLLDEPGLVERHARSQLRDALAKRALSLIHISEPTRRTPISYAVFCLKKKT